MPRGGRRENAGKKSRWESGRSFAETKVIRVPIEFADQLLEIARKLDAGGAVDLDTNSEDSSLQQEVEELRERVRQLESRLSSAFLRKERDRALAELKIGKAASRYKDASKVLNAFIDSLVSEK